MKIENEFLGLQYLVEAFIDQKKLDFSSVFVLDKWKLQKGFIQNLFLLIYTTPNFRCAYLEVYPSYNSGLGWVHLVLCGTR